LQVVVGFDDDSVLGACDKVFEGAPEGDIVGDPLGYIDSEGLLEGYHEGSMLGTSEVDGVLEGGTTEGIVVGLTDGLTVTYCSQ